MKKIFLIASILLIFLTSCGQECEHDYETKKIEVTWRKIKGVTGYEVQYSTYSNFKKGVRTKRITGASKGKVTITGLKKNKKST